MRTSYELYGVDFLVNLKHEVILLEINPEPSMKVFNMKEQDQMVGADPFQRVPSTFVKVYSKEMLNALNMLRGRWYIVIKYDKCTIEEVWYDIDLEDVFWYDIQKTYERSIKTYGCVCENLSLYVE